MEADLLDDWELSTTSNAITLVVVGKTGNGKSATGNSILGSEAFKSDLSASGVKCTSEIQSTILKDGRSVNIIDTPGFFDLSSGSENVGKEIVKCIDLAKDGIHAVLIVFSIGSRFTREEEAAIQSMKTLFGDEIVSYMIVVFTGGDTLESKGKTLNDYINCCPDPLKEGALRRRQMEKEAEAKKGYTEKELFALKEEIQKSYDDQLKHITAMVEQKLNTTIKRLEKQLPVEQAARMQDGGVAQKPNTTIEMPEKELAEKQADWLRAEKNAKELREKSDEIRKLIEDLKRAWEEYEEIRNRTGNKCVIL
ncbi:Protein AIG1 [Apostasia shenzhenica]|uniref:Protein AIG1 n=1 Tax=Apostasia shenzhenica TaxID=1088818 RepID=A0A2I0AXD0_9ASPA|nr:Protein AIG1 [Apostasia shenzhenica]